ncbi:N-acetylglucosamine kinase [Microbacterium jiangjiandongii]|uniref:N-acetylglucosamine kinase n=1 Tax=Microbacterium jiangjiandongii TaxID=3049071 RepID=UPI00214CB0EE|nr:BadF/BadG/BcrA/BcrD ATPase family protein [Microbacterium sp. zg.Y843]MCR2815377.1 ATPase [Microbacterium sp. zg.Y843]
MSVAAVDLGKTGCRVRVGTASAAGVGFPGLADADGVGQALAAVAAAFDRLPDDVREGVTAIGVGAAGAEAARSGAAALATALAGRLCVPAAVASDAVTAHAGAFAGSPGTIVIVGTGTVLITLRDGALVRVDGWGPWLGDEGSGRWIGQEGLRAVLAAHDGRGPRTTLSEHARAVAGPPSALPAWVSGSGAPARQLARFAPSVLSEAGDGDPIAQDIVARAARAVAHACTATTGPYCLLGGIAGAPAFRSPVTALLTAQGAELVDPRGDACDGAEFIARRRGSAYEGSVERHD